MNRVNEVMIDDTGDVSFRRDDVSCRFYSPSSHSRRRLSLAMNNLFYKDRVNVHVLTEQNYLRVYYDILYEREPHHPGRRRMKLEWVYEFTSPADFDWS